MFKIIAQLLSQIFSFGEKAIKPEEIRIKKLIRNLTKFGAEINHIEIQDDYLFVKYHKDGQEQSSRFKL